LTLVAEPAARSVGETLAEVEAAFDVDEVAVVLAVLVV
jgi:hypothetical protein